MTIRLSTAQARALSKLDRKEPRTPAEIGETAATCDALVIAGYARKDNNEPWGWGAGYTKLKDVW